MSSITWTKDDSVETTGAIMDEGDTCREQPLSEIYNCFLTRYSSNQGFTQKSIHVQRQLK
jgi:hypothetical protein